MSATVKKTKRAGSNTQSIGVVYVLREEPPRRDKPAFKIGHSDGVFDRKRSLGTGNSATLHLANCLEVENSRAYERAFHKYFEAQRVPGKREWFYLLPSDLGNIGNPDWRAEHILPLVAGGHRPVTAGNIAGPTLGSMPPQADAPLTHRGAAERILRFYGRPMHHRTEISAEIERLSLTRTNGKTLYASVRTDIGRHIDDAKAGKHLPLFKFCGGGVYGLVP